MNNNKGKNMLKFNLSKATLDEMDDECWRVKGTPYGHNMIALICDEAKKRFGEEAADELFNKYQKVVVYQVSEKE